MPESSRAGSLTGIVKLFRAVDMTSSPQHMMRTLLQMRLGPRRSGIMATAGSLILVLILLGGYCTGQSPGTAGSENRHQEDGEMRRVTVDLSAPLWWSVTAMGFLHTNPPPWPRGNHLTLISKTNADSGLPEGEWALVNMHAENYAEIIKLRQFKTLEFGLMPDHRCFVVDSRVPQEWFLDEPGGRVAERLSLRTRFPNFFRKNAVADSMVGTKRALVSRDDPGGLSERTLPGEKLRFGVTNLTCEVADGTKRGERLWELFGPACWAVCVRAVARRRLHWCQLQVHFSRGRVGVDRQGQALWVHHLRLRLRTL
jgi:hypothetical protein